MKFVLIFFMGALGAFGLTKDEIKKLVDMPHSRENLTKELKIFPDAREYLVSVTAFSPGQESKKTPDIQVKEKVVQGKYLISQFELPAGGEMTMVVEFDRKEEIYLKWVVLPGADVEVAKMVGTADVKSRTIAWTSVDVPDGFHSVSLEQQGDKIVTWSEVYLMNGKVVNRVEGKAVKVR